MSIPEFHPCVSQSELNNEDDSDRDPGIDPWVLIEDAAQHVPECQCAICVYGANAWLFNFNPSEY